MAIATWISSPRGVYSNTDDNSRVKNILLRACRLSEAPRRFHSGAGVNKNGYFVPVGSDDRLSLSLYMRSMAELEMFECRVIERAEKNAITLEEKDSNEEPSADENVI